MHGHPWLYKVTHDGEWTDRVTLACVWVCVVLGDEEWSGMLRCACAWPYIVLHGSEWSHVVTHGSGDIEPGVCAHSLGQGTRSYQLTAPGAALGMPNASPGFPQSLSPARTGNRSRGNSTSS